MKRYILLFSALIVFFSITAVCGEVPTKEEYIVKTVIEFDTESGIYKYTYNLLNPIGNRNMLRSFDIYMPKDPDKKELSWENLIFGENYSWHSSEANKDRVIAVGLNGPEGWTYGIGFDEEDKGFVSSGSLEGYEIAPGKSLDALIITSYGIPALRDFEAMPDYVATEEEAVSFAESEDEYISNTWAVLNRLYESLTYYGKTIGPTAPPAKLVPADFLQNIIDMKHQAMELGWVTNEGIRDSLDMKLEAALKKLQSGNTKAAKNILGAFIKEVEAQGCESYADCPKGKHLSPEAYALLKFNAQYLMDNLK